MGGIFGFTACQYPEKQGKSQLLQMARAMEFRGRLCDTFFSPDICMGLSVYGFESNENIFTTPDKRIMAVCEGEIYNSGELCQSLGNPPQNSDCTGFALVPFLYQEKGKDFARSINGVFSIALWDQNQKTLLLVRDHLGSHSIFYHYKGPSIAFASTIKSLLCLDRLAPEIDAASLNCYLASLAISPPRTMYKNILAVRPGHAAIFRNGGHEEYAYWPINAVSEDRKMSRRDFAGQLRQLFEDAVAIRSHSANKYGALISGGVDTSAVVATLFEKSSMEVVLHGFSIAFNEKEYSDAHLQQIMYDRYNIRPHQIVVQPRDFTEALSQGVSLLDSPVNDVAYAGMYLALKAAASQGCEVVFEGEGSDEIFCTGHSRGELEIQKYLALPFVIRRAFLGPFIKQFSEGSSFTEKFIRMLARIGMDNLQRRSTWIPAFSPKTRRRLLGVSFNESYEPFSSARYFYNETQLKDDVNIYQYGLTRLFLPDDLLYKNERMAAGAGVINRTPFIDYRLVEAAFRVPAHFKMDQASADNDGTKIIFKDAVRGLVPDAVLDRKKTRGFSQPTAIWYRSDLKEFVHGHLMVPDAKILQWLDKREVHKICSDFWTGKINNDYFVNSLLILELWLRSHL
jgi:asparagine synthase (glutamine-hydrolysing)